MTLSGARPRGPKPELDNKSQLALLHHLHALNHPYRVSYEMVVRKVWSDSGDVKIRRARARDLSRQFRGEKRIEWDVIENYVELLYPEDQTQRAAQLEQCRPLHLEAFGEPDAEGVRRQAVDPEYVAELERQLDESRMRATFATALLVIVRSENAVLRGKNVSFDWFQTGADGEEIGDPVTAPIRRQGHRNGYHHRRAGRPIVALSDLIGEQPTDSHRSGAAARPSSGAVSAFAGPGGPGAGSGPGTV
ncbi:hypothetical protein, partial [Frankia canadensis]|uniref:hypothetical protein n=1 Tax=Frankia canadensis TaxID=1836972 RepID=UPI001A9C781A